MKKPFLSLCLPLFLLSQAVAAPEAILAKKHQAFLNQYCMDCHDAETEKGSVNLEDLSFNIKTIQDAELWQEVLAALNSGEMPPEKKKQPTRDQKASFLDDLSNVMVKARKILSDSGGKITMRRLNKREYKNSIETLVGVKLDDNILPIDGASGDFDTVGASLFISSDKFEKYLNLGRKALDEFYAQRASQNSQPFVMRIEPELKTNAMLEGKRKRDESVMKRFMGLKKEVDQFLAIPKNKVALSKIKKKGQNLHSQYQAIGKLKEKPDAKKYGFRSLDEAGKTYGDLEKYYKYFKHYYELPHRDRGAYLQTTLGATRFEFLPKKMPIGTYKLRLSAGTVEGSPAYRHFIELGHPGGPIDVRGDFEGFPIKALNIKGSIEQPEVIETDFEVKHDTLRKFAVRERRPTSWHSTRKILFDEKNKNGYGHAPAIWVDWMELEGPIAKPQIGALANIYAEYRDKRGLSDTSRARLILKEFSKEAFRTNKPSDKFIESIMAIFKNRLKMEKDFDLAIRTPLSIILASPRFIYMNEAGEETPQELSNLEAAVRLSYFLWSSPPDEELLSIAQKKNLKDKKVLNQQVERMLKDPRAHKFVAGLAHQWLDMKRLDFFQFNPRAYREFDENLRTASREEIYQTILHLLNSKDSGQIHNLLKSDYVVVNAMMAAHYGINGVTGDHYRKVGLSESSPRGGFLGMAAIHAMGSDGNESSPVERGTWVLRHLLNDPPPPAPANVPQLSRLAEEKISKMQKLKLHQEEPQCASCHRKIDPIGFGLENFNATGKWRTAYDTSHLSKEERRKRKGFKPGKINASGAFYKGPAFKDFFQLRDRIYDKKDDFARGFTEALIEYGLGRPFAFTDETLAKDILKQVKRNDYQMHEFVHALVQSKPFWTK